MYRESEHIYLSDDFSQILSGRKRESEKMSGARRLFIQSGGESSVVLRRQMRSAGMALWPNSRHFSLVCDRLGEMRPLRRRQMGSTPSTTMLNNLIRSYRLVWRSHPVNYCVRLSPGEDIDLIQQRKQFSDWTCLLLCSIRKIKWMFRRSLFSRNASRYGTQGDQGSKPQEPELVFFLLHW
jgi:hypothetical protein